MSFFGMRSRDEFGGRLRSIARVVAGCRAEIAARDAARERRESIRRDPRHVTLGQILLLVALWALGFAAWRLNR